MEYNYYEILEVSPFSAQHEITHAYERARSTYSGDNPAIYTMFSQTEARELLRMIEEAYSVLGNKSLRALYDEKIGQGKKQKIEVSFESLKSEALTQQPTLIKKSPVAKTEFKPNREMDEFILNHREWSGADLKKVREYKNLSLQTVSEVTKITPFYIQAVEEMNPQNLPASVFVRGYVGQIAKVMGLEEKKVADAYMKLFRKP